MRDATLQILGVDFVGDAMRVRLSDGRALSFPIAWYPRLAAAESYERANYRLLGDGEGIHWPDIDEDLSLDGFLNGWPAPGSTEYSRRSKVQHFGLEADLVGKFDSGKQVNDALRDYLRMKRDSA